ncbi:hypothetical protein [Streptomyces sp. NPDC051704]|uniref:hypothetical protein n=1 Tax=Streptomyces sp. NPDC051704 TaxID=3365671 RepID=UPI00379D958B
MPRLPRTAIRPLTRPALTTYPAVLPGPPGPALRQLPAAAAAPAPAPGPGPGPAGPHG